MALTDAQQRFVNNVAKYVQQYAPSYGIKVYSPIIAQAILESGWGKSSLAAKYHNYFGLKAGTAWKGKTVNMKTGEEYTPGVHTTISAYFRVYDSMEEGIKGYFEFIQLARYSNLRGVTDPKKYLEIIKADGYATSGTYVKNTYALVTKYNLTQYDISPISQKIVEEIVEISDRVKMVNLVTSWLGRKESDGSHKYIIDQYNKIKPLPIGYKMTYSDSWCAAGLSAAAYLCGLGDKYPLECSCPRMITKAKDMGIWVESDAYEPKIADWILYDWQDSGSGDNKGTPDHVGMVTEVNGSNLKIIECNLSDSVKYRTIKVNGRYIRGYVTPKLSGEEKHIPDVKPVSSAPSTKIMWTGKINGYGVRCRSWAGTTYSETSFSPFAKDQLVQVCDQIKSDSNNIWYYVYVPKVRKYGFVYSKYVTKI